jgi:hypothetical protein
MAELSEAARSLRLGMWLAAGVTVMALGVALAGARRWIPIEIGRAALPLVPAGLITALWLGLKARGRALADRDRESGQAMTMAMVGMLGRQDQATLERIRDRGGPAGDAAALILAGRAERAARGETGL